MQKVKSLSMCWTLIFSYRAVWELSNLEDKRHAAGREEPGVGVDDIQLNQTTCSYSSSIIAIPCGWGRAMMACVMLMEWVASLGAVSSRD